MKKIILISGMIFMSTMFFAQSEEHDHEDHVHGEVYGINEKGRKESLPGAMVFWLNTTKGVYTDQKGKFEIDREENQNRLVIAMVGYEPDTLLITEQKDVEVTLQPTSDLRTIQIVEEIGATMISLKDAQLSQVMTEKELCKAACCNLSESFETNASIDASFTDAITGTRQIKMLGLDGRYTQVMFDNIPSVRGLASIYGLSYVPGPWIREISISKGVGSVINGHESITGQINVAHKNIQMKERLFINAYAGSQGRLEFNAVLRQPVNKHWNSMLHLHGAMSELRFDMNNDGFLDNPLFRNAVVRNEWAYAGDNGVRGEYTLSYHHLQNTSGQYDFDPTDAIRSQLWGVNVTTDRYEFSGKTGYVFEEKDGMSLGSQVSVSYHDQRGNYGERLYDGQQLNARANLLFASEYSEKIKQTSGVSFVLDDYTEILDSSDFSRTEQTFGIFSEHTFTPSPSWSIIAGIRGDYHNTYGFFATPRLHARYSINENTSVKIAAGMGYRSPNLLMDNVGLFASNRSIQIQTSDVGSPYGMKMEEAINLGLVFTRKFKIFHRDATLAIDLYRTDFREQIVVDWETPTVIKFYQLDGPSFSNSAQVEMQWSPIRRLQMRVAYRWLEAKTQYGEQLLLRPLIAQHRAFTNLEYSTKEKDNGAKWMFDMTVRWLGEQRLPNTASNPHPYHLHPQSDDFFIINAQVSKHFNSNFEIYVGGENLGNFMQMSPIIAPENPQSPYFDASLIWGPVFGRMGYVGLRWRIG
jgi:outer membrane receptor for ferrienterochelin and colicin